MEPLELAGGITLALAMQGCLCQPRSSSLDPRLTNPGLAPLYIKECPVSCPTGPLFPAHPTGLPLHISGLSWATSPKPRKGRVPSQGVAGKGVQLWACVPQAALHMLKEDTCLGGAGISPALLPWSGIHLPLQRGLFRVFPSAFPEAL